MLNNFIVDAMKTHGDSIALIHREKVSYNKLGEFILQVKDMFNYKDHYYLPTTDEYFVEKFWSMLFNGAIPVIVKDGELNTCTELVYKEDEAFALKTSGTTGQARFIQREHNKMKLRTQASPYYMPFDNEVLLNLASLYHGLGISQGVILSAYTKSTMVILDKFTPTKVFNAILDNKVSIINMGSQRNIPLILKHKTFDRSIFSCVKYAYSSGEFIPYELKEEWEDKTGVPFIDTYGMSEAGIIASEVLGEPRRKGSIGKPISAPDYGFRIVDNEIQIKGEHVIQEGWYPTGDLGKFDDDGYVYLLGRK